MDEPNPRKRPRPVVSCLRCRDKKLKCDRSSPCENCVKAQTTDTCTYQRGLNITTKETPSSVSMATVNAVDDLQVRLAKVEEMLGIRGGSQSASNGMSEMVKTKAIGTVVVKGSRSIFHGQSDRTTLLNQFLDVKEFINEMSNDKQVQASAKQIKFLQNKSKSKIGSPDSAPGTDFSVALLKLREFLPPKPYCDRLVDIYCQHFERTFRVLHIPTFKRRYNQIWMPVSSENADVCISSSIVPEVTAVMTMAYHMDDAQQLGEDANYRKYLKDAAMDLIQAWLDELGRKQRTELSTLQVNVLLLLSRSLRGIQPEQLWSATGALVRSAMVMGLNVDPASVKGITPYMAEMRRRLWATILEVDLQASMFCGMPLVIPDLDSSSIVPSNLEDTQFDESSTTLPTSRPNNIYTESLFQVVLAASLPQRMKALSVIQHSTPDLQDGIKFGRKVEECLSRKPEAMSLHDNHEAPRDSGSLIHRVFLDLYMRRPLIRLYMALIHGPEAQNPANQPLIAELEQHCLESSRVILSYQDLYTIPALATVTASPWAQQNFFYNACKMDVLWAALTLCQEIRQCHDSNKTFNSVRAVEATISYLINRIEQKGSELKDVVFLALVLRSVQISPTTPNRFHILQQTAKEILATCREKLLQPLLPSNHPHPLTVQPVKRTSIDAVPLSASMHPTGTSPHEPQTPPLSRSEAMFPLDLPAGTEQYFGDLDALAAEYHMFQPVGFDPNDAFNFNFTQPQNYETMWQ